MGCTENRQKNLEEMAVVIAEKGLGFGCNNCITVDSVLRKYSSNNKINHAHLGRIASKLNLRITSVHAHTKIDFFYRSLLDSEGLYNLQDLLTVGILLSKGSPVEKSRLFYQVLDIDSENSLQVNTIQSLLLRKIANHSIKSFPRLVTSEQSSFSNIAKNEKYMNDLESVVFNGIRQVMEYFKDFCSIDEENFVRIFGSIFDGKLTSPSGWREFLMEVLRNQNLNKSIPNRFDAEI